MVWSYPGALFLAAGGYHHHLGTNTWSRGPSAAPDQARLLDWEVVVPDAGAAAAAARSLAAAGHAVREADGAWSSADPWGTALCIVAA
jgi:catechol 2,3-dioxygenase